MTMPTPIGCGRPGLGFVLFAQAGLPAEAAFRLLPTLHPVPAGGLARRSNVSPATSGFALFPQAGWPAEAFHLQL